MACGELVTSHTEYEKGSVVMRIRVTSHKESSVHTVSVRMHVTSYKESGVRTVTVRMREALVTPVLALLHAVTHRAHVDAPAPGHTSKQPFPRRCPVLPLPLVARRGVFPSTAFPHRGEMEGLRPP